MWAEQGWPRWHVELACDKPWCLNPTHIATGNWDELMRTSALPQGRAHELAVQLQMVSPENMHPTSIIQTEQVIFRDHLYKHIYIHIHTYIHTYIHIHVLIWEQLLKKEAMTEWKVGRGVFGSVWRGLEGGTRKGEMLKLNYYPQTKLN